MPPRTRRTTAGAPLIATAEELQTGPCVRAIRAEVAAWRDGGYDGVTDTTRRLLSHWFKSDHRMPDRRMFSFHHSQREALEALVYLHEVAGIENQRDLLTRYVQGGEQVRLPSTDIYPRHCIKMATGSGKTMVMSLVVVWQYMNAVLESSDRFASTFLVLAPNVIVLERLQRDFRNGATFRALPFIPRDLQIHWDMEFYMRDDADRASSAGALYLTNIQQLYERADRAPAEPDPIAAILGPDPSRRMANRDGVGARLLQRGGRVLVINDEAHHTHEENKWMQVIFGLDRDPGVHAQLDFTATPRFQDGRIFPWTVYDYPLRQAIDDGIVKRPMKGVATFHEAASDNAGTRYAGYLTAAVERWREYRDQLGPSGKRPLLFVMLNTTTEVDQVVEWLQKHYPEDFSGGQCLPIHVNLRGDDDESGGVSQKDLEKARKFVEEVDLETSPVNAVVSVLMLREGWDVQNVTVVVGLRPYTSKAKILPEQAIGRGLRLMFRGRSGNQYRERVDIIGNKAFIDYVDDLEKLEGVKFDQFDLATDKLTITTVAPVDGRHQFDVGIPELSRMIVRRQDLGAVIAQVDVGAFGLPTLVPAPEVPIDTLKFEGYDLLTGVKEIEREFPLPQVQTPQEVIAYYATEVAHRIHAPGHFAPLALKMREYFVHEAFGAETDLEAPGILPAMAKNATAEATVQAFVAALRPHLLEDHPVRVEVPARSLYTTPPFPWSRPLYQASRSVFNFEACDNQFEVAFARWLDHSPDCRAFAKLPRDFGFSIEYADAAGNLRLYYPDFVAVGDGGAHWILETKGQEDTNVALKDLAALNWCRNATSLGVGNWRYVKVPQVAFERIQPDSLAELPLLVAPTLE